MPAKTSLHHNAAICQDLTTAKTGIIGQSLREYAAFIGGKFVTTLYGTYDEAHKQFTKLCDEYRSIPVYNASGHATYVEWYVCQTCGDTVDIGERCHRCVEVA